MNAAPKLNPSCPRGREATPIGKPYVSSRTILISVPSNAFL